MTLRKFVLCGLLAAGVIGTAALVAPFAAQATPGPYHCHVISGMIICHEY